MDNQNTRNTKPTQIQKCPYYDPVTRETIKPGKTCPDYNSLKGCPYAHPFEIEKWDGENPLDALTAATSKSRVPSTVQNAPPTDTPGAAKPTDAHEKMEIDGSNTQNAAPEDRSLVPVLDPSKSPPDPSSPAMQKEAVSVFLTHIISALRHGQILTNSANSLTRFKALYKAYTDRESQDLTSVVQPGAKAAWLADRKRMAKEAEKARTVCLSWVDGLASLDGRVEVNLPRIEDGQDTAMQDAMTVFSRPILSEENDLNVEALMHHRARLQRGRTGERVVALRYQLEELRERLQEQGRISASVPLGEIEPADRDTEMKDESDSESPIKVLRREIKRLEGLLTEAESTALDMDDVEMWAKTPLDVEWFAQDMNSAIDRITQEYLARLPGQSSVPTSSTEQTPAPRGHDVVLQIKKSLDNAEDIRNTSETLEKILGSVPPFELHNVLQPLDAHLTTAPLENILNTIDQHTARQTSFAPYTRANILKTTNTFHVKSLSADPSLLKARRAPLALDSQSTLPASQVILDNRREQWNSEYEYLRGQMAKIVSPLAARTDAQEARLMAFGTERGVAGGRGGHVADGSLVSTQVSVQGAMG
ncbi:hypothetical protein M408DRAFT_11015 [Serendipita vermifera MAFF 305830]|uniref:Uncharacterized protein n=1 Tax=Serendipita vermifera MAFF 305830 TaxID=933852 RepID=A0A0C2X502_SERVB|nr:hypothetical protein M408DRAFT_11015 [Serendipita vermifera MAFF 305830]